MPYATNPVDGVRTYFEDSGGAGPPVLFYTGFADPLEVAKSSGLARALTGGFRLVFADHRGQGGSDKPREVSAYALSTRVADALAVLEALGVERAHFLGSSWGARLGFALGELAPERVLSLVLCGNQPYAWDLESPIAQAVAAAIAASRQDGMKGFVETFEAALGYRFPEPERTWTLEKNDPAALEAAWRSAQLEGPVSQDLSAWRAAVSHLHRRSGRDARRCQESGWGDPRSEVRLPRGPLAHLRLLRGGRPAAPAHPRAPPFSDSYSVVPRGWELCQRLLPDS